uniref:Zinc finger protein 865 n=1 Tax=Nothobranchius pienaari TaxID=704102 RepID=A0A1A8LRV2_9TELE
MDSQLASVLTSGSLQVQNDSQRGGAPGAETVLDPPSTKPGNLKSCSKAAGTIRQDAQSINGKKPEEGGASGPASQEAAETGGQKQPITAQTGVPVLHREPIRIKIVVPSGCKRPIAKPAFILTKDCAASHGKGPVLVSAGANRPIRGKRSSQVPKSAAKHEADIRKGSSQLGRTRQESDGTSFQRAESPDPRVLSVDWSGKCFLSNTDAGKTPAEMEKEQIVPHVKWSTEVAVEEQMEPLDLSLPKRREHGERGRGRFLGGPNSDSPLIMEVDEYEGDGDRDMVEEDSEENSGLYLGGMDITEGSPLSPSTFMSLPPEDCDPENLLLIDDQGIPYRLSPDELKVLQVDASMSEGPQSDQVSTGEQEVRLTAAGQSSDASSDELHLPSASAGDPASEDGDQIPAPEIFTCLMTNSDSAEVNVKAAQEEPPGMFLPPQPIQILTNPTANAPLLFLTSSSSSSLPAGLSLPLSSAQMSPGASTPMFLLLSSVSSSPDDSTSTSTPIAVLDPSTGQLSQVTAASAPVSLGSPLPPLSNPVISPLILSGVSGLTSSPVLTSLAVPLQDNHLSTALIQTQINNSDSNPGTEAMSAEESENKPSTFETCPQTQSAAYDPSALPASKAEAQSPASEPKLDSSDLPSEHLPLDDHLYFSNLAAPPSPPIGPLLPSGKLDSLEALDPLSPAESPTNMGSRRVLCCQLCPRIFFYLSDLERHAITHSQKKPHVCQQCGKAFKRSSHLQRHKHIHTGQRNFVCPICAKRFREAGELQRHQRVHTGEKPYQCQLCHTRFAERNTLRRHTKRKHPYHQVAMEMLNERRDRGGDGGGGVHEEEESAEWYSSAVSTLNNSESETES